MRRGSSRLSNRRKLADPRARSGKGISQRDLFDVLFEVQCISCISSIRSLHVFNCWDSSINLLTLLEYRSNQIHSVDRRARRQVSGVRTPPRRAESTTPSRRSRVPSRRDARAGRERASRRGVRGHRRSRDGESRAREITTHPASFDSFTARRQSRVCTGLRRPDD